MNNCFFFHKWETLKKGIGYVNAVNRFTGREDKNIEVVWKQQHCSKCKKERALVITLDGYVREIDQDFIAFLERQGDK